LKMRDRVELTVYALRHGLVTGTEVPDIWPT
jgi:hypothetical protein